MARKRTAVVYLHEEEDESTKTWRANPPGPEQKELNRMFQKGIIGSTDTAAKVRTRNPMFLVYPAKTFALHFRTTKAKFGLNAAATTSNAIPELAGIEDEPKRLSESPVFMASQLEAINYPHMTWTYTDHVNQKNIVCVMVPTVTGSRDIKFIISDDGMQLFIEYVWPVPLLDTRELFFDVTEDDGSAISLCHPMVYSYRTRMDALELSEKSRPGASLVINLPVKVQRELGTYKKSGLTCGDTKVVMLQLTAYQKSRVISDADMCIKF